MKAAWMSVGKAQRDVPAHVAHEYCRPDRSFDPTPLFNEPYLPRNLTCSNYFISDRVTSWFPLAASNVRGLGVNFALYRGARVRGASMRPGPGCWLQAASVAACDLAAVSRLDKVRSYDLTQLSIRLLPTDLEHTPCCEIS
jgi:hypothetical protein